MQYCTIWTSINRSLSAFLFEKKNKNKQVFGENTILCEKGVVPLRELV